MGIEKNIHQNTFRNDYQKAMVNIVFTTSWIQEQVKVFLKEFDITSQQYNILRILRGKKGPMSVMHIRERMLDKMSDTSRLLERLIKKGLVVKTLNGADKRLIDVAITQKGLETLTILDTRNEQLDGIMGALSEEETITLNALLDKLRGE